MTTLSEFLSPFYPDFTEAIYLRGFKPHGAESTLANAAVSFTSTREQIEQDANFQARLKELNRTRGLYFVVNAGGAEDKEITRFNAWFVESDSVDLQTQHDRLDNSPLPPSIRVETRKSVHAYWLIDGECTADVWRDIQLRLIAYFDGDRKIKNSSRVMRLPFFQHLSVTEAGETARVRVNLSHFDAGVRFTPDEMRDAYAAPEASVPTLQVSAPYGANGFASWEELNAELKRRIMAQAKINNRGIFEMRGICHAGNGETALMFNPATGAVHCNKECPYSVILNSFGLPDRPLHPDEAARAQMLETSEHLEDETTKTRGIYTVDDLSEPIDDLYERGLPGGASTGWPALDWHYTVKRGLWTVVTGIPGMGKSAILDAILVNLAVLHGWRFCVCSPENQPLARHASQLMALWAGEPFGKGAVERMSVATKERAKKWLGEHFTFILPDEADCTVDGILALASIVNKQREIQGLVIDPWNELEHRRPPQMNETEYVGQSLTRIRRYARSNDIHLWVVAHPTKLIKNQAGEYPVPTLYDISGSAHWRSKADMGLVVWRDVKTEHAATEIHVQKIRFREDGRLGMVKLYFDLVTGRFSETQNVYYNAARDTDDEAVVRDRW